MRDFEAEKSALEATDAPQAVHELRTLHEAWARAVLEVDASTPLIATVRAALTRGTFVTQADAAAQRLNDAVRWQWVLGDMNEIRTLQLARAWLLIVNPSTIAEARALALEVTKDTRIEESLRHGAQELLAQLANR